MIEHHEFALSGNCHKVRLLLSLLGLEYRSIRADGAGGAHKRPDFLRLNPWGQVPVLSDDGLVLRDSQAILIYLAKQYGGAARLSRGGGREGWQDRRGRRA